MKQKNEALTIEIDGARCEARVPYLDADHCLIDIPCPHCAYGAPVRVHGGNCRIDPDARHDTWIADGYTVCCDTFLGLIRFKIRGTIFGIEEDARVMSMGIRIF